MEGSSPKSDRWRRVLSGFVAPKAEQEMREAQDQLEATGATPIVECGGGSRSTVAGVLKSVSLRPRAGVPALEADLFDGTGHLTLVFLGRRSITGIEPGRRVVATGRITCHDSHSMMYNPRYQLLPTSDQG